MVRFYWLLLSICSVVLFSLPAQAGRLLFWRFEPSQNQLVFTTDDGVQPTAKLIANPTRLVIDLPGTTLGRPTVKQSYRGRIREIRVGQFENRTTRIVIELQPGYTLDPERIQFRGSSPTQWSVTLPEPERGTLQVPDDSSSVLPSNRPVPETPNSDNVAEAETPNNFRVTGSGFFLRLRRGQGEPDRIQVNRSRDRRQIAIELEGVRIPRNLRGQNLAVNRFGVSTVEFEEESSSPNVARVILNVTPDSPDWEASSRRGNISIVPTDRIAALQAEVRQNRDLPENPNTSNNSGTEPTVINLVRFTPTGTQLIIQGSNSVRGNLSRNRDGSVQITIANAQLARGISQPRLRDGSPISRLELKQQDTNTVAIVLQTAAGVQVGELNQIGDDFIALELRGASRPIPRSPGNIVVPNPSPERNPNTRIPNGRVLVVIDPGHGGRDPGAIGLGGLRETDVILPISKQVNQILQQNGVEVIMTRSEDYFISLEGRTRLANRAGADLFVSIHANAVGGRRPDVNGIETYYYSSGRSLAQTIHNSILQNVNVGNRGVRRARFFVLRNTSMPAVLVEVGFLTGNVDSISLANPNFRSQMAQAIANGILQYIRQNRL